MLYQQISPITAVEWQKKLDLIRQTVSVAEGLFSSAWQAESIWEWLKFLRDEMLVFNFTETITNNDDAFFMAIVVRLDWKRIAELHDKIHDIERGIGSSVRGISSRGADSESWTALVRSLGLNEQGVGLLAAKVFGLSSSVQFKIVDQLTVLSELYEDFYGDFRLFAATLLYYSPSGAPARLLDIDNDSTVVTDWAPVLRILAQAIHSRDGEALAWAGKFLYISAARVDGGVFENLADHLLFITLLHLSFGNFSELNEWRQARAIEWYLWWALCSGVLVEKEVRGYLAGRPLMYSYIVQSGSFSELLKYSAQLIRFGDSLTVGGFIKGFLAGVQGTGRDSVGQDFYIDKVIAERKWPADIKYFLQRLLYCYVHLRDCDLVDYHGMLEEEKFIPDTYDWKKVISKDIGREDIEKFREYFKLLDRPAWLKAKLITAFESVSYDEEPYIGRILLLSDLYTEIFPSLDYSPIAYFDEQEGKVKFNKKLPDSWYNARYRFGIDENVRKEAEEYAKKQFDKISITADIEME